jgi:uncharacterized protein (TIGR01777 family)
MVETILITGASGLVGQHLSVLLREKGYRVLSLSRHPKGSNEFLWDLKNSYIDPIALKQTDHIIHLAGAGIGDSRWTEARKKEILDSRVLSCELLYQKCMEIGVPLKTFVSASAVGYYGDDDALSEEAPAGEGFLASVCRQWEQVADRFEKIGVRTVKIRTGIVLAADGGILPQMALPIRLGFGFAFGNGKQFIPWIHIDDLCMLYLQAVQNVSFTGAYNAVAPESVTNRTFTKMMAAFLNRPFWPVSAPAFLVRWLLGERSELLLKGSKVQSVRLFKSTFRFANLSSAIADLYSR